MLKQIIVDETVKFIDGLTHKARVTIDGAEVEYPIYKTLNSAGRVKKLVYLQSEQGRITNAKLVDVAGRILQEQAYDIVKGPDGLIITFVIDIKTEGAGA